MARIAGVDLPRDKRIEIALTYIYGIGLTTSQKLLKLAGVNPDTRTRDLTEDEVVKLRDVIDKEAIVEGDLRRERQMAINRLLPRPSSPLGTSRARTEHEEQRPHEERSPQGHRRQEEGQIKGRVIEWQ